MSIWFRGKINHLGCWKNTQKIGNSLVSSSGFFSHSTNVLHGLSAYMYKPQKLVVYCIINFTMPKIFSFSPFKQSSTQYIFLYSANKKELTCEPGPFHYSIQIVTEVSFLFTCRNISILWYNYLLRGKIRNIDNE